MKITKVAKQESNTEDKIKEAARVLFQEKGFSATKTRDIAEAAGINLALLNYYFRSKQKLYNIIMEEAIQKVMPPLVVILNDKETSIEEKLERFVALYIDLNISNKNFTFFIIDNIQRGGLSLPLINSFNQQAKESFFFKQFGAYAKTNKIAPINPLHLLMNILGLTAFPFLVKPMFEDGIGVSQRTMDEIMEERKRLIPVWIKQMLRKE